MKTSTAFTVILLLLFYKPTCAQAPQQEAPWIQQVDSLILEKSKNGDFNGNVLIGHKGKVVYKGSFGFSNGSREPLNSEHRFLIGSIQGDSRNSHHAA